MFHIKQKVIFLIYKILHFISTSIKCIRCRICDFQKNYDLVTYSLTDKVIHRGAPLLNPLDIQYTHLVLYRKKKVICIEQ